MTEAYDFDRTTPLTRVLAGFALLASLLACSGAAADLPSGPAGAIGQSRQARADTDAADAQFIAQFRRASLPLSGAIAVAEALHPGSRAVAATFENTGEPGFRVRTTKDGQVWENVIGVDTRRAIGRETPFAVTELAADERNNVVALGSVVEPLSDAIAIAEKATGGKTISAGLVRDDGRVNFVALVLSDDGVKEISLVPPRAATRGNRANHKPPEHGAAKPKPVAAN